MSFVSEPYAEIVDSLLTALTGGYIYEDHVFKSGQKSYLLTNPPANLSEIKIFGSLHYDFHKFAANQDYEATLDEIVWMDEGEGINLPDDGTRFYLNYYPSTENLNPMLSDRNVGSITRLLAESFGREFALFSKRLEKVYQSAFVDTAEDRSLDQVVAILGLERKSAQFAVGNIVFIRDMPAPADIFIPIGFMVSTEIKPIKTFQTIEQKVLRKGQLSVTVPIRATIKGEDGLAEANMITMMNQPLLGIDRINNPNNATFGTESETDEQFRKRAKSQLERAGKTTLNALKYALLAIRAQSDYSKISQLRENDIKIEEDFSNGPGLVRILLDADKENTNLVHEVNKAIFETRAAGIMVVHNLNSPTIEETPDSEGATMIETTEAVAGNIEEDIEKPIVDLKKIKVKINMAVSLLDMSMNMEDKNKLISTIKSTITDYFENLSIGQKVVINRLINNVMNLEGIQDVIRLQWTAKLPNDKNIEGTRFDIQVPPEQKAIISDEPNSINIILAGSPVRLDFSIDATIAGDSNLPQSSVENEIEMKLERFFDQLTGNVDLDELEQMLDGNEYTVTSISVNVEHTETGLIIRDAQKLDPEIVIGENEIAVIGMVRINITGGVEGA